VTPALAEAGDPDPELLGADLAIATPVDATRPSCGAERAIGMHTNAVAPPELPRRSL